MHIRFAPLLLVLALAAPARALIKVDMPLSRMYETSKTVVVGSVSAVNADNRVLDVKVADAAKGDSPGQTMRIQLVNPAELVKRVAAGAPVAVFVGRAGNKAVVHLADTWLLADEVPNAAPPAWRVVGPHDARGAFPGRTSALVELVGQLKAGKCTLLDEVENKLFKPDLRQAAKLGVTKPAFMAAADVNGDRKPDLLIGTAGGVKFFLASGDGYQDATQEWGLAPAAGTTCAVGDANGDGKLDLLLGKTLWLNDARKFTPAKATLDLPDSVKPLSVALLDVTGDKKPDAVFLTAGGQLRVFENGGAGGLWKPQPARGLWQNSRAVPARAAVFGDFGDDGKCCVMVADDDGLTRYALGAEGGQPADFERLTGMKLSAVGKAFADGLKNAALCALDVNGDHRLDLLVMSDAGGLLLVNRGFGAFLVNADVTVVAQQRVLGPGPSQPFAAADTRGHGLDDLLILNENGELYVADNIGKK